MGEQPVLCKPLCRSHYTCFERTCSNFEDASCGRKTDFATTNSKPQVLNERGWRFVVPLIDSFEWRPVPSNRGTQYFVRGSLEFLVVCLVANHRWVGCPTTYDGHYGEEYEGVTNVFDQGDSNYYPDRPVDANC